MVTVETRIQKEIHRLIVEETWKHLKTSNNFDMVLSLVTLLDPYTPEPDYCYEDCKIMCGGCYDGNYSLDWRAFENLINEAPFRYLTSHELDRFVDGINDKVHKCDEFCSEFICYKYIGETCRHEGCCNLFIKTKSNMKYCSCCKNNICVLI